MARGFHFIESHKKPPARCQGKTGGHTQLHHTVSSYIADSRTTFKAALYLIFSSATG